MKVQLDAHESVTGVMSVRHSRAPCSVWLPILVACIALLAQSVIAPGTALATYPGANGELAVDVFTAQGDDTAGPQTPGHYTGSDALVVHQSRLVACTAGISDEAIQVPCDFGRPVAW